MKQLLLLLALTACAACSAPTAPSLHHDDGTQIISDSGFVLTVPPTGVTLRDTTTYNCANPTRSSSGAILSCNP